MITSGSSEQPARVSSPHDGASHAAVDLRELEQTTPPVGIKSSPSIDNRLLHPTVQVAPKKEVILFGCFRLSVTERLLEQSGSPVKLSGRALDILIALVERAGEIVDKRNLMAGRMSWSTRIACAFMLPPCARRSGMDKWERDIWSLFQGEAIASSRPSPSRASREGRQRKPLSTNDPENFPCG